MADDVWNPQTKTDPATAATQWTDFLTSPANQSMLMQFGISAMQPVGLGQTPFGALGQSIGEVGEGVDRRAQIEQREELASAKIEDMEAKQGVAKGNLGVRQQNANTRNKALNMRGSGISLTSLFNQNARNERELDLAIERAAKTATTDYLTPNNPYVGKSALDVQEDPAFRARIAAKFKANRPSANVPQQRSPISSGDPDADDDAATEAAVQGATSTVPMGEVPPMPGAVKHPTTGDWIIKQGNQWMRIKM